MIALMVAVSLVSTIIIILIVKNTKEETDVKELAAEESSHQDQEDV